MITLIRLIDRYTGFTLILNILTYGTWLHRFGLFISQILENYIITTGTKYVTLFFAMN